MAVAATLFLLFFVCTQGVRVRRATKYSLLGDAEEVDKAEDVTTEAIGEELDDYEQDASTPTPTARAAAARKGPGGNGNADLVASVAAEAAGAFVKWGGVFAKLAWKNRDKVGFAMEKAQVAGVYTAQTMEQWIPSASCGEYKTKKVPGPNEDSFVLYPVAAKGKKFPLISFAHGAGGNKVTTYPAFSGLLTCMASSGYVVAATTACSICDLHTYSTVQLSLLRDMQFSKEKYLIDFENQAVVGFSLGGGASVVSAARTGYNVKAAIAMHPGVYSATGHPLVPVFYSTGSKDTIVPPAVVKPYFERSPPGSIFVTTAGETHMGESGPMAKRMVKWELLHLDCYLKNDQTACNTLRENMCIELESVVTECEYMTPETKKARSAIKNNIDARPAHKLKAKPKSSTKGKVAQKIDARPALKRNGKPKPATKGEVVP